MTRQCQACVLPVREDQDHLSDCKDYSDLRQGLDMKNDANLVEEATLLGLKGDTSGVAVSAAFQLRDGSRVI